MKHKATKQILSMLLAVAMLIGFLPVAAPPASAAGLGDRYTINSVAITVDRPIAGEPLSTCVPKATRCQITCTWSVRDLKGITEIPASTIAEEGTTYFLAMELTPIDLYTFADSVTGTVNGNAVTVKRTSSTQIACMVRLTPTTRVTDVAVSVPQPARNTTPGTPTAADGHTLTNVVWWKSELDADSPESLLGENEVFSYNYDYYMEATVTAASSSLFGENTAVTVNGKTAEILEQGTNTIRFRYHVDSSEIASVASQIYVADGDDGCWTLTRGETKTNGGYTASYQNGILTLTNTGDSTISGFYNDSTLYYGIYADGDLTLHVNGDFRFDLSGTPDTAARVYGIYTVGNLTLVNKSGADCTVSFTPADGVLATHGSSGIYCETGSLTVENEGGGDFTLNADAAGVRPVDGSVVEKAFTNNGIYADGSIIIGENCTVNATAADVQLSGEGETTSRGIYAYRGLTIGKNAVVTAAGGDINPSRSADTLSIGFSQYCYGVEVRGGDITVNGGRLTATGGNIDYGALDGDGNATYGEQQDSYGIYAADITLSGGDIIATAGISRSSALTESSLSEGICCNNLTVSSGDLEATADDAWWESTGLRVLNNLTQTGGTITGTGDLAVCVGSTTGTGSRGIYVGGTLSASGGSLTGTGGTMGGNSFPSVGLQAGEIDLSGTAEVTGIGGLTTKDTIDTSLTESTSFANYPGDSIGVWTFSNLEVDDNAVLTATGNTVKGNFTSSAEAKSVGLYIRADAPTIRGSGKIVATGGETVYGGKNNTNFSDNSRGIYSDATSLTIDKTTVIAIGGSVCASTAKSLGLGYNYGGISYGLYLPVGTLTLTNGAKLTATGGANTRYSTTLGQPSKYNDSYGAYVKGDITVTDSVFTATGGLSIRTVGLLHGGAMTLNGLSSRLTASADAYHESAVGTSSTKYSYGAMNGDTGKDWSGGAYTVKGGVLLLQGQSRAVSYVSGTSNTLKAATILRSQNRDGSNATNEISPANFSAFNASKYVKADSGNVSVTIKDWTYGNSGNTPTYTTYEGEPTILWTGTTQAGASYSADTAPTEAGDYTVTVTYAPGGQTGSADFKVLPRSITDCDMSLNAPYLTYNGAEQTMGVTVTYNGKELAEGTDYTLSGNKQTNADSYTITATGRGNFEGTGTASFSISQKTPTVEDFNIPEIRKYAYTGEPVELPLPTLKEPMTGVGEISLNYYRDSGGSLIPAEPSAAGEYKVTFTVTAGDNFSGANDLAYDTLVIDKGANPISLSIGSIALPRGGSINIGKFVTNAADSDGILTFEIVGDSGCAKGSSLNGSTLTAGDVTGEFQVRITADGSANYNSGEVLLSVTVSDTVAYSISGTAVSWNNTNNAVYLLYDSSTSDADIKADMKLASPTLALAYAAVKGGITANADGKRYDQTFSFSTVPDGTYKLAIYKPGKYVPKIITVNVDSSDIALGEVKLWLYGDVNYDGKVNGTDAAQIQRFYASKIPNALATGSEQDIADKKLCADVNRDGKINGTDAVQIQRYYANKTPNAFTSIE